MDNKLDKSYDLQKHLTTLNTVSILITIALFDKLKEHIEPSVVFKVIKCFVFSMIFSLGYLLVAAGTETLGEELKGTVMRSLIRAIAVITIILSWGGFIYGFELIVTQFIAK